MPARTRKAADDPIQQQSEQSEQSAETEQRELELDEQQQLAAEQARIDEDDESLSERLRKATESLRVRPIVDVELPDELRPPQHEPVQVLLAQVMREIGAVGKGGRNEQQGYSFRGIDQLLDAAHPVFAKHGVIVRVEQLERHVDTRATKTGNAMTIVSLLIAYHFVGPRGDQLTTTVWGEGQDTADKATNKAMSAALKYALVQTLLIPLNDLDDADKTTSERPAASSAGLPSVPATMDDVLAALDEAARTIGKPVEELTLKWRQRHGELSVEQLRDVDKAALWGFVVSLAPYVNAAREQSS